MNGIVAEIVSYHSGLFPPKKHLNTIESETINYTFGWPDLFFLL